MPFHLVTLSPCLTVHRCPTNALITGSTGFVGSHLVERLLTEGMRVICLVRPATDTTFLKSLPVEIRPYDPLNLHAATLADADLLFHVAGLTRGRSLAEYLAANAAPTQKLIDAAPTTLKRFVYISSLAAVGPNLTVEPQDESTVPHPHDDYGKSKLAGERLVLDAAARLPVTILRPPGVYGPRDTNFLPLFRTAQRWGFVPSIGGSDKQFSLAHVHDLARGIHLAALSPAAIGQTFFLASGTHTMQEFTTALAAAINKPLKLRHIPAPLARLAGEFGQLKWSLTGKPQIMSRRKVQDLLQPRWTCTWQKARHAFNYQEQISLEQGLRETAAWYQQNP